MPKLLSHDKFMKWAREEFAGTHKAVSNTRFWPFDTAFQEDIHFVGDDHEFTTKVNESLPRFAGRLQKDGIQIPGGEITVVSHVRKAKAYQVEASGNGVWTLDRIRELPKSHPLVIDVMSTCDDDSRELLNSVRQWFAIGRFQATAEIRPPISVFMYGFCEFKVEGAIMGGVFILTPWMESVVTLGGVKKVDLAEIKHALTYECCETLRQVAAIVYL